MIHHERVYAFKFHDANRKRVQYWRDIGTLDAYWEANMDLVAVDPLFNLYDEMADPDVSRPIPAGEVCLCSGHRRRPHGGR